MFSVLSAAKNSGFLNMYIIQSTIPPDIINKLGGALDMAALFFFAMACVLIGTGLTAVTLAARAFWTDIAEQLDMTLLGRSSLKRLLMGMINAPALIIIASVLSGLGPLRLVAIALLFALLILIFLGFIAESALIGRRVLALRSEQRSLFAQTIAGGATITAAFLLPFVGQALLLVILFRSLGTAIYWLFNRSKFPSKQSDG